MKSPAGHSTLSSTCRWARGSAEGKTPSQRPATAISARGPRDMPFAPDYLLLMGPCHPKERGERRGGGRRYLEGAGPVQLCSSALSL